MGLHNRAAAGSCTETGGDNTGNILTEQLRHGTQTVLRQYQCDAADRITKYTAPGKTQAFGYDAFGNMWQSGTEVGVPVLRPNGPS